MWVNFVQESKSHRHHIKDYQNSTKLLYTYLIFLKMIKGLSPYRVARVSEWTEKQNFTERVSLGGVNQDNSKDCI